MKQPFYIIIGFLSTLISCEENNNTTDKEYDSLSMINWITYDTINSSLNNDFIVSIEIDNKGNKWIGTFANGIIKFDGAEWINYNTLNSQLPNDSIKDLAIDNQNNLWVGTNEGLAKFDGNNWTIWNPYNSELPLNLITAVEVESDGAVWLGCGHCCAGGLMKYNGENWKLYTPDNSSLPCRIINDIFIDRDENVWIATWRYQGNGGIVKISGDNWTVYNSDNSMVPYNVADDITQDSDGNIWVGVTANSYDTYDIFDGCLLKFDWNTWSVIRPHDQISKLSNRIQCVKVDKQDNIWVALSPEPGPPVENYELAMYNGVEWIALSDMDNSIHKAYTKDMEFDINNDLWIGQIGYGLTKMEIEYK